MSKKAALLTLWGSLTNYGQQLQAFALISYLEKKGYEVTLIRYLGERRNLLINFSILFNRYILQKKVLSTEDLCNFGTFQKRYLNYSSKEYYSYHELKKIRNDYDLFVTGSDQVWGPYLLAPGILGFPVIDAYCLAFRGKGKRGISYAASFGFSKPRTCHSNRFLKRINQLDAVSVREADGVTYLKHYNIDKSVLVPDPTLLFDESFYNNFVKDNISSFEKYERECFLYFVPNSSYITVDSVIESICKSIPAENIAVCATATDVDFNSFVTPTIFEWLAYIKNSELVFTNSYHCIIFCLLFCTNFYYIPLKPKYGIQDARVSSLLKRLNIHGREIIKLEKLNNLDSLRTKKIDWAEIKSLLKAFSKIGQDFLNVNI